MPSRVWEKRMSGRTNSWNKDSLREGPGVFEEQQMREITESHRDNKDRGGRKSVRAL